MNSNIVIMYNHITLSNAAGGFVMELGNGSNSIANVSVVSNTMTGTITGTTDFAEGYGWGTNVIFTGNILDAPGARTGLNSTGLQGQWYIDTLSNQFPFHYCWDFGGASNSVSYQWGARQNINVSQFASTWYLDDSHVSCMSPNVQMIVSNSCGSTITLNTSEICPATPIAATNGWSATFQWTNGAWQLVRATPLPPADLHVVGP
jgi:hypothetical protein